MQLGADFFQSAERRFWWPRKGTAQGACRIETGASASPDKVGVRAVNKYEVAKQFRVGGRGPKLQTRSDHRMNRRPRLSLGPFPLLFGRLPCQSSSTMGAATAARDHLVALT